MSSAAARPKAHRESVCSPCVSAIEIVVDVVIMWPVLTLNGIREFFTDGIIHCWKSDITTWHPTTTSSMRLIRNLKIESHSSMSKTHDVRITNENCHCQTNRNDSSNRDHLERRESREEFESAFIFIPRIFQRCILAETSRDVHAR